MNKIITEHYERISKPAARKRFYDCKSCYFLPCKMNPENMWMPPMAVPVYDTHNSFTDVVNSMEYYNCNAETGGYGAFYVRS